MWLTAFGWLAELFGTFGSMIPRNHHLLCTDVGVSIKRGSRVRVLQPGVRWFWPYWTEIFFRAANLQTKVLPSQTLTTSDRTRITIGGMVRYTIPHEDEAVILALVKTDDVDKSIIDESLAVYCEHVTSNTWSELCGDRKAQNTKITLRVRSELKRYGVNVERAQITNLSECDTVAVVKTDYDDTQTEPE